MDVLKTVDFDQIISDSATINGVIEARLVDIYPFAKHYISMQEAIDIGILPQPEIICVSVVLSDADRKLYNKMTSTVDYWQGQFHLQGQRWRELKYLSNASARKRFISQCKTEAARNIIASLEGRYVCFCGSVEQAKLLGGRQAIHAKNRNNELIIRQFNEGETDSIFSCQMIIEGMNLFNVEKGIIVQLDGTDRTFIQKSGRILRGNHPVIYILYVKDTKDESYLRTALQGLNTNHIKFRNSLEVST